MTDAFELLGLPRQAALEAEQVKTAYLERCRAAHPDQAGGDEQLSAELNAAHELLREPEGRLKHLLELEGGEQALAWATVPMQEPLMGLFGRLGALLARIDGWGKKRDAAASALARALLANEQMSLQEELELVSAQIDDQREVLVARLPEVDALRAGNTSAAAVLMRQLRAQLAYLGKWKEQVCAALLQLI